MMTFNNKLKKKQTLYKKGYKNIISKFTQTK